MNIAKLVSLSIALLLIQACEHPIDIDGLGDVVGTETYGAGTRGCTHEEADATPPTENCTKNYVVGAYEETYTAVPEDGWQFHSWVNCAFEGFSTESGNTCTFSVPATTVQAAWGSNMPPLTAVFKSRITNDGYPPLGGVTFISSGSDIGKAGGKTWSFSSFVFSAFDQLWYGFNTDFLPKVSMNNGPTFTPGENLSFSIVDSDLENGKAVWTGVSNFTYGAPTPVTSAIPVRFTLLLLGVGATEFIESSSLLTSDPDFDTSQAVLAEVTGDFSINLLIEGFKGGVWTPYNDLFDSEHTVLGDGTRRNFGTAFYSTAAVPE